jgi:hypothetical protein
LQSARYATQLIGGRGRANLAHSRFETEFNMKTVKKALITLVFGLVAASAHAQGDAEYQKNRLGMCRFYKHFATDITRWRDAGTDETQAIADNDRLADENGLGGEKSLMHDLIHQIFRKVDFQQDPPQRIGALVYARCMTGTE